MSVPHFGRIQRLADWAVGIFSPERAALRQHFRRMEHDPEYGVVVHALMRARGYRAAKSSDKTTPWLGGTRSADAEILTDLPSLRNRSREVNRDDPIGSGLTGTLVRNIIGTGLRPHARTMSTEKNQRLEAVWSERRDKLYSADGLLHVEAQKLVAYKFLEDGEVFIKQSKDPGWPGESIWFEIIEADRVSTPLNKTPRDADGEICDGIEKDRWGRVVAYHIRKRHPGDTFQISQAGADQFLRVPVEQCRHLKRTERPGQSRGVPIFHAILQDLRDLDLLLLASLKRVQIAACLAVFIKSEKALRNMMDVTAEKYGYRLDQTIEPGMMFKLHPNEEVQTLLPNFPTPEFEPFIIMIARRIGAALGVSWQVVLKDFAQSTYSSARTDLLESRQMYVEYQGWFGAKLLDWEWRTVMEDARLRGDRRLAGIDDVEIQSVQWFSPGWRWIDPLKEAQANAVGLRTAQVVLDDLWIQDGKDPDTMRAKIEAQSKWLKSIGLSDLIGGTAASAKQQPNEPPKREYPRFPAELLTTERDNGRHNQA